MAIKLPKGFHDLLPEEKIFWEEFKTCAFDTFGAYGYVPIETPIAEPTDLFVRGIGESTDVVSKEMFTAISGENLKTLLGGGHIKNNARMSLRPEGTAGVVRSVVEHDLVPQGSAPAKLMYAGPMFRAERPQEGRQRQFNQVGIECLGADKPSVDAEGIIMLMRFYERIGIPRESMTLFLNSMGCESCRPGYRQAVLDYLEQHKDELCEDCLRRMQSNPLRAFDCKVDTCSAVMEHAPRIVDYLCDDCKHHHDQVKSYLALADISYIEDQKLVRGLDYYTRTVFEVQTSVIDNAQNAIGGGGRYDKLAEEIGGRPTPGFGFALGYERCAIALRAAGAEQNQTPRCDLFVACVTDDQQKAAFSILQQGRDAGLICEMSHQQRSVKSQFKLANKLHARFVVTLGPDEVEQGSAIIRNMDEHEEVPVSFTDIVSYLDARRA